MGNRSRTYVVYIRAGPSSQRSWCGPVVASWRRGEVGGLGQVVFFCLFTLASSLDHLCMYVDYLWAASGGGAGWLWWRVQHIYSM